MGWIELVVSVPDVLESWFERNDDDIFDRINHRWTVVQLVIFAGFLSAEQYIDQPINCWVPVHFHDAWEKYTNSYCWIRNTYYLPFEDEIPKDLHERERHPILYYQWVPLILLMQALMFYLPILLWRNLNSKTGINVNAIVESAEAYQKADDLETRSKTLDFTVHLMDRYLGYSKNVLRGNILNNFKEFTISCKSCIGRFCCCCCGKRFGNYMSILYIIVKLMFLANAISQFFILDSFLGNNYHMYGIHALKAWFQEGTDFGDSKIFPKVTLCDMEVRRLGNLQRYTVQCVLSINLLNQMVYLYVWFWLVFVIIITVIGLFLWIMRMGSTHDKASYVKMQLACHPDFDFEKERFHTEEFKLFVRQYLKQDGIFVLRLVDLNTNKLVVRELVGALWEFYKSNPILPIKPTTELDPSELDTLPIRGKSSIS